jgi:hypothetical protein
MRGGIFFDKAARQFGLMGLHAVEEAIMTAYPRIADVLVQVEPTSQTRL